MPTNMHDTALTAATNQRAFIFDPLEKVSCRLRIGAPDGWNVALAAILRLFRSHRQGRLMGV
ncbi:MAG: hypothetical protein R3F10_09760 [Lysobacteraceae bacterium]